MNALPRIPLENGFDSIDAIIIPVVRKWQGQHLPFPEQHTYVHILQRLCRGVRSIRLLAADGIAKHEHAISLLSRTILTDYITIADAVYFSAGGDCREALFKIYSADVTTLEGYLEWQRKWDMLTQDEHDEHKRKGGEDGHFVRLVRDHYKGKLPHGPRPTKIADSLPKDNPRAREVRLAYEQWFIYGKTEHVGYISTVIIDANDNILREWRLRLVILFAMRLAVICLEQLREPAAHNQCNSLVGSWQDEMSAHPVRS